MTWVNVAITVLQCLRCNHRWTPRPNAKRKTKGKENQINIRICPKCKSPYWDVRRGG